MLKSGGVDIVEGETRFLTCVGNLIVWLCFANVEFFSSIALFLFA